MSTPRDLAQACSHWLRARLWQLLALVLCAGFLASVARFYHPGVGFSALIQIPRSEHPNDKVPALAELPHYEWPPGYAYDGSSYVQLAMTPLLRDPAIDRALDAPAYRARRILFSWTAYLIGLGRPAWILQAYALQNAVTWLALAWLLTRWLPLRGGRQLALWTAVMFSHGLLISVRYALVDGPSLLLLALAVRAAEGQRTWTTGAVLGIAGLGRETNLLTLAAMPLPRSRGDVLRVAAGVVIAFLPLLLWQDYLYSIYRSTSWSAGAGHIVAPLMTYVRQWLIILSKIGHSGFISPTALSLLVIISLSVQALYLLYHREFDRPWWRMGVCYAGLMFVVHAVVWEGYPGAITRVALPMTAAFNVLLMRCPRAFWGWFLLGNLHVIAGIFAMPFPGRPSPF